MFNSRLKKGLDIHPKSCKLMKATLWGPFWKKCDNFSGWNSFFIITDTVFKLYMWVSSPHTYIIGHYNPSIRIIDLISHSTYIVCVFDRFFEKLFMAVLIPLKVLPEICWGNRRRNTFCILFWCLAWGLNPDFTSNKPTHYLLDYGNLKFTTTEHFVRKNEH